MYKTDYTYRRCILYINTCAYERAACESRLLLQGLLEMYLLDVEFVGIEKALHFHF